MELDWVVVGVTVLIAVMLMHQYAAQERNAYKQVDELSTLHGIADAFAQILTSSNYMMLNKVSLGNGTRNVSLVSVDSAGDGKTYSTLAGTGLGFDDVEKYLRVVISQKQGEVRTHKHIGVIHPIRSIQPPNASSKIALILYEPLAD